jgi:hypothetical protein
MADVSAHTPIFSRGSTVLDYWLAHAEGMIVQPIGARVEEVVFRAPIGRAESLIVRSRMTHRLTSIPADSIIAVEPSAGHLLLEATESRPGLRMPRPSPERVAAVRASSVRGIRTAQHHTVRGARWTRVRSGFAVSWLRPRVVRAGSTTARHSRLVVARTATGVAWLTPRIVANARVACATGARWTIAAAVSVARVAARAGRELERAAAAGAERGRTSLELRRARQRRTLDE